MTGRFWSLIDFIGAEPWRVGLAVGGGSLLITWFIQLLFWRTRYHAEHVTGSDLTASVYSFG